MKQILSISCRGSEEVRSKMVEKQIQSVPLQWRRTDAEFPVQIQLKVKFVAYSPALIRRDDSRWQDVAVAHLYFLDCWDGEKYRLDVRSDLIEWFATLRDAETNDWLVVFDTCKARESKGRGQVLEKLRTDLSKYGNRIVEIDSAANKMPVLFRALADQALVSFDYWAQRFESCLKTERDACFSLEWSFYDYMIIQVQYSSLLLSAGVFEQSLAQLDELDAMLSLLISHYTSSPVKAKWVEALEIADAGQSEIVSLMSVHSRFDDAINRLVRNNSETDSASTGICSRLRTDLRQIRSLIFACQLAVILNRHSSHSLPAETTCQRVIWYGAILLQAIRKEEAVLSGKADAESPLRRLSNALWCLEIIHLANQLCDLAVAACDSEPICTIWTTLCRMIQNFDVTRTSDSVVRFLDVEGSSDQSPLAVLSRCVTDSVAYDEHFVRWHESALAMLKHYQWLRHARVIGISLANFYGQRKKDVEALRLLLKVARQLEEERWCQAYIGLLRTISNDQWVHCSLRERLKFFGDLACAKDFFRSSDSCAVYCSRFKHEFESDWSYERVVNSLTCPWFILRRIRPHQLSVLYGSVVRWSLTVDSQFSESLPLLSASLCYSLTSAYNESGSDQQRIFRPKKLADFRRESYSVASDMTDCSDYYAMEISIRDGDFNGVLLPGANTMEFAGQCSQFGLCVPEHVHLRVGDDGRLDVQVRILPSASSYCVVRALEPEISLKPSHDFPLWAGVTQAVKFCLMVGSSPWKSDDSESDHLRLESLHSDLQFTGVGETEEDANGSVLLVRVPPDLSPGASIEIEQMLFCNIHGSDESRTCEIVAKWRGHSFRHQLQFKPIFHWISSLKVIGDRLLLTITLYVSSQRSIVLHNPKLSFSPTDGGSEVDAELLNAKSEQELNFGIPYTLAWNIPHACSSSGVIVFHYQYKDSVTDTYTCYADVFLQRPAVIEACCQLASEKIVCRVGMSCDFVVSLKSLDVSLRSVDVLVTLAFDTKFWSHTGGLSELVRLKENGLGQAFFQVAPECVGFLPMPGVEMQLTGEVALTKTCQAYVRSKGKQIHVLAPLLNPQRSNDQGTRKPVEIGL